MFVIAVQFDDGDLIVQDIATFEVMWEIKEWAEGEGLDVAWDYEP